MGGGGMAEGIMAKGREKKCSVARCQGIKTNPQMVRSLKPHSLWLCGCNVIGQNELLKELVTPSA